MPKRKGGDDESSGGQRSAGKRLIDLQGVRLTTFWTQCLWGKKKDRRTEEHDRKWLTTNWPPAIKGKFSIDPELTISWLQYMVENSKTIEQKKEVVNGGLRAEIPQRDLREGELECLAALLQKYEKECETSSTDTKAILNADAQTKYRACSGVAQLGDQLTELYRQFHGEQLSANTKQYLESLAILVEQLAGGS